MSDVTRTVLRKGAQYRGDGFSIGFIATALEADAAHGAVAVRLGIAGPDGRASYLLGEGESAPLPGGGTVRLAGIAVSPDGTKVGAALELHGRGA